MKLAFLLNRFPKPSETFIERELRGLRAAGLDFDILPLRRKAGVSLEEGAGELEDRVLRVSGFDRRIASAHARWLLRAPRRYLAVWREAPHFHRRRVGGMLRFFGRFLKTAYLASWLQQRGVSHIHAHWATHPTLAAYIVHRLTGLPFSFTAHAQDIWVDQTFLAEKLSAAKFVVTCNEQNARFLRSLAPRAEVHVVHHGLSLERYARKTDYSPGLRVFCAARLAPTKGLDVLLRACARLKAEGLSVSCRIAGDGPMRAGLAELADKLGVGECVTFTGFLAHREVIREARRASMVVLPCTVLPDGDRDGIPNTLIESLAVGVPVISTRVSAIPELVKDGVEGLLVPQGDAEALADAMRTLAADPGLQQRLGAAGRAKVAREYDLERSSAQLVELFRSHATPPASSAD